ncbi:MAG: hypothetical protein H0V29_03630 [Thermoleophilaceae bacterium]|nr:hypothetical protein [Thermoleophilaceae bacterium]
MQTLLSLFPFAATGAEPAGGAATGEIVGATAGAMVATGTLLLLIQRYRDGKGKLLERCAAFSEKVSGLPGWAALPSGVATVSLLIALLGMYWDIALHIDDGRDAGPLANPAHYLILFGLFGIFAAGCLAIALPRNGERPGPAPIKIMKGWYAPVGGVLMAAAGGFALAGFPLDDMWHRLFGQDVTLWGPTHLMLIGGAGMTLIGQAILLIEGMRARGSKPSDSVPPSARTSSLITPERVVNMRRIGVMGGLLIGLSTFQAEFDFGVPQFRFVFQPLLIAVAAGVALVAARMWIGRGAAIATALFFLTIRGGIALIVGPGLGETTPALPIYLGSALAVEAVFLLYVSDAGPGGASSSASRERNPLATGVLAGLAVGTIGFASEWAWSHAVMPIAWTTGFMPEALILSIAGGIAAGALGALMGCALLGDMPSRRAARTAFAFAMVAIVALVMNGLATTEPRDARAIVTLDSAGTTGPDREATATVRVDPPSAAENAAWLNITAWQGGGLVVEKLDRVGEGVYRTAEPVPVGGPWKTQIRLHDGRMMAATPVYLPEDAAIPAKEIPAPAQFERPLGSEIELLQRERKQDVAGWIWGAAGLVVLLIAAGFILALAWGLGRVARAGREDEPPSASGAAREGESREGAAPARSGAKPLRVT